MKPEARWMCYSCFKYTSNKKVKDTKAKYLKGTGLSNYIGLVFFLLLLLLLFFLAIHKTGLTWIPEGEEKAVYPTAITISLSFLQILIK